ncbi:MAG: hypothetical protein EXR66_04060 [Dehalococcoidia bacterium]|nr:hypothetical protein [Dehalococcoidia bacterium]
MSPEPSAVTIAPPRIVRVVTPLPSALAALAAALTAAIEPVDQLSPTFAQDPAPPTSVSHRNSKIYGTKAQLLFDGYEFRHDGPDEVVFLSDEQLGFLDGFYVRPLDELAPGVADIIEASGGSVTAAVVVPEYRTIYVANPEVAVPMASIVKLVIMLAVLDAAESEGRTVTAEEIALLDPMVTWSDNDSATWLWDQLGGAAGIDAYLERVVGGGIVPDPWAWGDSRASGAGVAILLARLAFADLVSSDDRALALNLLAHVSEDQRWGVGGSLVATEGAVVGVKDGWFPVADGWRAGSAGVLVPLPSATGGVAYSIAVLTAQNETLEGGIETIQGIAALVHAALYPQYAAAFP